MHNLVGSEGTNFNFNGGFDGDVYIDVDAEHTDVIHPSRGGGVTVRVPAKDILSLVANYVRNEAIGQLDQMEDDDILSILKGGVGV